MDKSQQARIRAVEHALFKATGATFTGVDHGMVTSFYSTTPFMLLKNDTAHEEDFVTRVYDACAGQIAQHGMTSYGHRTDPTSLYGAVPLNGGVGAFIFELRFPLEQMQLPHQMLEQVAGAIGKAVAPEAKRGTKAVLTQELPVEAKTQMADFLKKYGNGPSFSLN